MNSRNTILDELKALNSELSPDLNQVLYTVPDGYFEGLASLVLARIKAENADSVSDEISNLSPLLAGISRKMPYAVPHNYFGDTAKSLSSVTSEEEESLVLSFISKEMPYDVPKGYFANFPEQVLEKVTQPKGKVVSMGKKRWMPMAAAAMVAGIISVSAIFYFNNNNNSVGPVATKEAVAKELNKTSTEELNEFLENRDITTANTTVKTTPKAAEVKTFLQEASVNELEAFLDEVPTEEEEIVIN